MDDSCKIKNLLKNKNVDLENIYSSWDLIKNIKLESPVYLDFGFYFEYLLFGCVGYNNYYYEKGELAKKIINWEWKNFPLIKEV